MLMVIPNVGKINLLYWALCTDGSDLEDFILKLFKNNYTPVAGSVAGDFTEATFTGYSAVSVLRSEMGTPAITSDVAYTTRSSAPTFTCSGGSPQDVYGWFLVGATSGDIIMAQRFDATRTMSTGTSEAIDPFKVGLQTLH